MLWVSGAGQDKAHRDGQQASQQARKLKPPQGWGGQYKRIADCREVCFLSPLHIAMRVASRPPLGGTLHHSLSRAKH
jgi:hypothetical protein